MAFSWEARGGAHKQLTWEDFEQELRKRGGTELTASTVASCLRVLLERFEESEFISYLVIPSPNALALHLQIPLTEIYQALKDLSRQGYQTETSSHYSPIVLWDPLIREKTQRRFTREEDIYLPSFESSR